MSWFEDKLDRWLCLWVLVLMVAAGIGSLLITRHRGREAVNHGNVVVTECRTVPMSDGGAMRFCVSQSSSWQ